MSIWSHLAGGLRALIHRRRDEQDMDEELRGFLEASVARKIQAGTDAPEAWRAARLEMGASEYVKDQIRDVGWESGPLSVWSDVRHSIRVLRKAPGFTFVVVLTLALGIGANTAIFSLIDSLLLRSLPVHNPEELVRISRSSLTNPLWEQIRDRQDSFSGAFAWSTDRFNLAKGGVVSFASGLWVSGDFFRTLGLRPAAGRLLTAEDDRRGCSGRAVLSYGFWQGHFGGASSAIGSTINLEGHPFEVIGVAPREFFGMDVGTRFEAAIPLCASAIIDGARSRLDQRSNWWLDAVGRRKPGLTLAQVQARIAALSPAIFGAVVPQNWDSKSQDDFKKRVLHPSLAGSGLSTLREGFEQPLHVLMVVVGLVLLIACANIASLLLARAAARGKEMALRQALGASRGRLVRQLLTESLLLSLSGALLGLICARFGDALLVQRLSTLRNAVFLDFSPDGRTLAFTAGVAVLTALLFGVAPAFRGTRQSLITGLKEAKASDRGRGKLRLWIVASQVALSLVLLITAGLLLRSFRNLATLDIGFDRNQVYLVNVGAARGRVPKEQYRAVYDAIEERLRELPGVKAVAQSIRTPLGNMSWNDMVHSDVPNPPTGEDAVVWVNFASPSYFETLRTPLLAGRNFTTADTAHAPDVAVINETMARQIFPGVNPIGHTFQVEGEARKLGPPVEVIGVVKDAKYQSMQEKTFATMFGPIWQCADGPYENFEIRSPLAQSAISDAVVKTIGGINKQIPVEIHSLSAQVDDSMTRERLLAILSAFFGGLALLLAMIGLYGTLSYAVSQRRMEFGIRLALGARPSSILKLVMRDVVLLLIGGTAAGIAISLFATQWLQSLLFNLQARDPGTMIVCAGLLAAVSIAASFLAARRATSTDPMSALRCD